MFDQDIDQSDQAVRERACSDGQRIGIDGSPRDHQKTQAEYCTENAFQDIERPIKRSVPLAEGLDAG